MPAFDYSALDDLGKTKRGVIEADSERHARRQLRDQSLTPLKVAENTKKPGQKRASFRRTKVSADELALTTRLLGTLLKSGLPIDDALTALARQADSQAIERVVLSVRSKVLEGRSLAEGMAEYPQVFPDVYRATVGAGEQTQHLPLVLTRLAEHVEAREKIQKSARIAMIYPAVLTITSLLVVGGLLSYVVPEVVKVFDSLERELPPLTQYLIAISDFAREYGLWVLAGLLTTGIGFRLLLRRPGFRFAWHSLLMRTPLLGKLMINSDVSRFTRMLAIMLGSSVDMLDSLLIASKSVYLLPLREEINLTLERVKEGEALSKALSDSPSVPSIIPHLVVSGESSGNLVEMLDTGAESLEYRVENFLKILLGLLEPALILIMGAIVLLIVIAILLPIFDM
ncbi:MAG: type II secretion system F family protein, partial [Pseudomonadota bacterium]